MKKKIKSVPWLVRSKHKKKWLLFSLRHFVAIGIIPAIEGRDFLDGHRWAVGDVRAVGRAVGRAVVVGIVGRSLAKDPDMNKHEHCKVIAGFLRARRQKVEIEFYPEWLVFRAQAELKVWGSGKCDHRACHYWPSSPIPVWPLAYKRLRLSQNGPLNVTVVNA